MCDFLVVTRHQIVNFRLYDQQIILGLYFANGYLSVRYFYTFVEMM